MTKLSQKFIFITTFMVSWNLLALPMGEKPTPIHLEGDAGGRVDGKPWSSNELTEKISVVFYVDPDEKDLNNALADAIKNENFPLEKFQSVAIINMGATWAPNFLIQKSLEEKQKEFPNTIYVKDLNKKLVKEWGLGDDNSVIVLFDKEGKVHFHKDGKLDENEIAQVLNKIKELI